ATSRAGSHHNNKNRIERLRILWEDKKKYLSTAPQVFSKTKPIIHEMATTCTELMRLYSGNLGDVAGRLGGTLVSPPM
ncbi:unnamed protein product, partial [Sphacelaria rigidula]